MREILFRGKEIYDDGKWVIGHYAVRYGTHYIYFPKTNPYSFDYEYIIPETIGQYTGLTDRNGIKIFEGDVVDILTECEEKGIVEYEDGGFIVNADGFSVDFHTNINGSDLEIIGNIHDCKKGGES